MITELKHIIDNADSVNVMLTKAAQDGQYTATLIVKGGSPEVPPLQITGSIEELDDAISKAFNEASEVYLETHHDLEAFKEAAKQAVAEAKKPAADTKKPSSAPAKKKATPASQPAIPKPPADKAPDSDTVGFDLDLDGETSAKMKELGLEM